MNIYTILLAFLSACSLASCQETPEDIRSLTKEKRRELYRRNFGSTNMTEVRTKLKKLHEQLGHRRLWKVNGIDDSDDEEIQEANEKSERRQSEYVQLPSENEISSINSALDELLYEGDLLMTPEQLDSIIDEESSGDGHRVSKRQVYDFRKYLDVRWTDGVPYVFDDSIVPAVRENARKAMRMWEASSCVRFVENGTATPRVRIFRGIGCYSQVGRSDGSTEQPISIGTNCGGVGTIAHELGHTIGFFHEQSRSDRDSYLLVNLNNVAQEKWHNFNKEVEHSLNLDTPYDFGSLMHYGPTDFALDRTKPVLISHESLHQTTMGQSMQPSFKDLFLVNSFYECESRCKDSTHKCRRNGFLNPNDCSKCVCPYGFAGDSCEHRANGTNADCGATLNAQKAVKELRGVVGYDDTHKVMDDFKACHWHIKAPAKKRVKITLKKLGYVCSSGCSVGFIEVKATKDFRETGYRFCCQVDTDNNVMVSETNLMVISAYSSYYFTDFTLGYSYV